MEGGSSEGGGGARQWRRWHAGSEMKGWATWGIEGRSIGRGPIRLVGRGGRWGGLSWARRRKRRVKEGGPRRE